MAGSFLTNDLVGILKTEEFADKAIYDGAFVFGIFDDEDTEAQMADGTIRIVPQCVFSGRSEDFAGVADGDTLTIDGAAYTIRTWMDDGTGMIELYMEKQ